MTYRPSEEETNRRLREELQETILDPITAELRKSAPFFIDKSIAIFEGHMRAQCNKALRGFLRIAGVAKSEELSAEKQEMFGVDFLTAFNSALPPEFLYAAVFLKIVGERGMRFACVPRDAVPGINDSIQKAPICIAENMKNARELKFRDIKYSW
ncbi:MAG: hypothetical protein A2939_05280 [Parcubacteria group bacterium RIFCSPLOWO2_01_FULL_48_18]|nr:MAG: hypothetical protein A3J67_06690 [Parcubacteria group bacterium RIFCSPHIGHO2_02_FULL_48_10b]OHB22511.1 MAG: hypothetical protein A2939_05280 [Parcubacteria group bacterium RIFCSPLOWO2_01_FULL_48_18]